MAEVGRIPLAIDCLRYYVHHRRPAALIRALWGVIVAGEKSEQCELCGRSYVWWTADDDLYQLLVGDLGGLFCPLCFSEIAERSGTVLRWTPAVFARESADG